MVLCYDISCICFLAFYVTRCNERKSGIVVRFGVIAFHSEIMAVFAFNTMIWHLYFSLFDLSIHEDTSNYMYIVTLKKGKRKNKKKTKTKTRTVFSLVIHLVFLNKQLEQIFISSFM